MFKAAGTPDRHFAAMVRNVQADVAIQQYAEHCVQERRTAEVSLARQRWRDLESLTVPDSDRSL